MSPLKFNEDNNDDCYFFLHSQCLKGSNCPYRHNVTAKETLIICHYWLNGCCLKRDCRFRHSKGSVTYRKKEYEKINQERLYPFYDVRKLDKRVILPASRTSRISEVKTAIKSAVFSPAPATYLNSLVPYPIEPVVISFEDEESDSDSACSTPIKSSNDTECDSSTMKENLLVADKTFNTSEIKPNFKETEENRLERILQDSYQFYKPDPLNIKIKKIEEIRQQKAEKSGKRKNVEAPYANKNTKRMKAESSPSNLCNSLPANDVKSNSTEEMQIRTASHPVLKKNSLSSCVSPASVTKLLPVVEMEEVEQSAGKSSGNAYQTSATPAVNIFRSFSLDEGEMLLDYEPDDVLP